MITTKELASSGIRHKSADTLAPRIKRVRHSQIDNSSFSAWRDSVNYKAVTFDSDAKRRALMFEISQKRAVWDPVEQQFRCPPDTAAAGQYTNRLGEGCTTGFVRRLAARLGRGLSSIGSRLGDRREARGRDRDGGVAGVASRAGSRLSNFAQDGVDTPEMARRRERALRRQERNQRFLERLSRLRNVGRRVDWDWNEGQDQAIRQQQGIAVPGGAPGAVPVIPGAATPAAPTGRPNIPVPGVTPTPGAGRPNIPVPGATPGRPTIPAPGAGRPNIPVPGVTPGRPTIPVPGPGRRPPRPIPNNRPTTPGVPSLPFLPTPGGRPARGPRPLSHREKLEQYVDSLTPEERLAWILNPEGISFFDEDGNVVNFRKGKEDWLRVAREQFPDLFPGPPYKNLREMSAQELDNAFDAMERIAEDPNATIDQRVFAGQIMSKISSYNSWTQNKINRLRKDWVGVIDGEASSEDAEAMRRMRDAAVRSLIREIGQPGNRTTNRDNVYNFPRMDAPIGEWQGWAVARTAVDEETVDDVVPEEVVPEDVTPEDVPEDIVPEDVVPEEVVPEYVAPGGAFPLPTGPDPTPTPTATPAATTPRPTPTPMPAARAPRRPRGEADPTTGQTPLVPRGASRGEPGQRRRGPRTIREEDMSVSELLQHLRDYRNADRERRQARRDGVPFTGVVNTPYWPAVGKRIREEFNIGEFDDWQSMDENELDDAFEKMWNIMSDTSEDMDRRRLAWRGIRQIESANERRSRRPGATRGGRSAFGPGLFGWGSTDRRFVAPTEESDLKEFFAQPQKSIPTGWRPEPNKEYESWRARSTPDTSELDDTAQIAVADTDDLGLDVDVPTTRAGQDTQVLAEELDASLDEVGASVRDKEDAAKDIVDHTEKIAEAELDNTGEVPDAVREAVGVARRNLREKREQRLQIERLAQVDIDDTARLINADRDALISSDYHDELNDRVDAFFRSAVAYDPDVFESWQEMMIRAQSNARESVNAHQEYLLTEGKSGRLDDTYSLHVADIAVRDEAVRRALAARRRNAIEARQRNAEAEPPAAPARSTFNTSTIAPDGTDRRPTMMSGNRVLAHDSFRNRLSALRKVSDFFSDLSVGRSTPEGYAYVERRRAFTLNGLDEILISLNNQSAFRELDSDFIDQMYQAVNNLNPDNNSYSDNSRFISDALGSLLKTPTNDFDDNLYIVAEATDFTAPRDVMDSASYLSFYRPDARSGNMYGSRFFADQVDEMFALNDLDRSSLADLADQLDERVSKHVGLTLNRMVDAQSEGVSDWTALFHPESIGLTADGREDADWTTSRLQERVIRSIQDGVAEMSNHVLANTQSPGHEYVQEAYNETVKRIPDVAGASLTRTDNDITNSFIPSAPLPSPITSTDELEVTEFTDELKQSIDDLVRSTLEKRRAKASRVFDRIYPNGAPWQGDINNPDHPLHYLYKRVADGDSDAKTQLIELAYLLPEYEENVHLRDANNNALFNADGSPKMARIKFRTRLDPNETNNSSIVNLFFQALNLDDPSQTDFIDIGHSSRRIEWSTKNISHSHLFLGNSSGAVPTRQGKDLGDSIKGAGLGSTYIGHANRYMQAAGFTSVSVSSAYDGVYVWPRSGFRTQNTQQMSQLADKMGNEILRFRNGQSSLINNEDQIKKWGYLMTQIRDGVVVGNAAGNYNYPYKDYPNYIEVILSIDDSATLEGQASRDRSKQIKDWFSESPIRWGSGVLNLDDSIGPRELNAQINGENSSLPKVSSPVLSTFEPRDIRDNLGVIPESWSLPDDDDRDLNQMLDPVISSAESRERFTANKGDNAFRDRLMEHASTFGYDEKEAEEVADEYADTMRARRFTAGNLSEDERNEIINDVSNLINNGIPTLSTVEPKLLLDMLENNLTYDESRAVSIAQSLRMFGGIRATSQNHFIVNIVSPESIDVSDLPFGIRVVMKPTSMRRGTDTTPFILATDSPGFGGSGLLVPGQEIYDDSLDWPGFVNQRDYGDPITLQGFTTRVPYPSDISEIQMKQETYDALPSNVKDRITEKGIAINIVDAKKDKPTPEVDTPSLVNDVAAAAASDAELDAPVDAPQPATPTPRSRVGESGGSGRPARVQRAAEAAVAPEPAAAEPEVEAPVERVLPTSGSGFSPTVGQYRVARNADGEWGLNADASDEETLEFLTERRTALLEESQRLQERSDSAQREIQVLVEEPEEVGDESGEGGTDSTNEIIGNLRSQIATNNNTVVAINDALERIDSGTYGLSQGTDQSSRNQPTQRPINPARLEVLPYATFEVGENAPVVDVSAPGETRRRRSSGMFDDVDEVAETPETPAVPAAPAAPAEPAAPAAPAVPAAPAKPRPPTRREVARQSGNLVAPRPAARQISWGSGRAAREADFAPYKQDFDSTKKYDTLNPQQFSRLDNLFTSEVEFTTPQGQTVDPTEQKRTFLAEAMRRASNANDWSDDYALGRLMAHMQDLYDDAAEDDVFVEADEIQQRVQKMLVAMLMENSSE